MKAVMCAAQAIATGQADVRNVLNVVMRPGAELLHARRPVQIIVAGGMESMTNTPYYLPKARFGGMLVQRLMRI